jgi:hypothetical protein
MEATLDVVRHILKYIKHTLQCGIFYKAKNKLQVHGYTNVDWAVNVLDRRSTSGFMFFLEVVLLVGAVRKNQQLHYQAQRQNIKVQ